MPRSFDSDEVRGEQHPVLAFSEFVTCPVCHLEHDGVFLDSTSLSVEDIVDPPQGTHTCPSCGTGWTSAMTGWTSYTEAGG